MPRTSTSTNGSIAVRQRFDAQDRYIDERFDAVEQRFDAQDRRLDSLKADVTRGFRTT